MKRILVFFGLLATVAVGHAVAKNGTAKSTTNDSRLTLFTYYLDAPNCNTAITCDDELQTGTECSTLGTLYENPGCNPADIVPAPQGFQVIP